MSGAADAEPWPYKPADASGWPEPGTQESSKALYDAKLEVRKKRTDEAIAVSKALRDADFAGEQAYFNAVFDVAKGSLDRTRSAAETVQKASGAIVTLYTGILALAFSVSERPLPFRAVFAAVLLGIAVVLSTAYLAYLPDRTPTKATGAEEQDRELEGTERLANIFVRWTRAAALDAPRLLRASVVALAAALAFLPAAFVSFAAKGAVDPSSTKWPTVDAAAGSNIELQKIVYRAQVAEAAAQRKAPIARDGKDWLWWILFGVALLAIWLVPRRLDRRSTGSG